MIAKAIHQAMKDGLPSLILTEIEETSIYNHFIVQNSIDILESTHNTAVTIVAEKYVRMRFIEDGFGHHLQHTIIIQISDPELITKMLEATKSHHGC